MAGSSERLARAKQYIAIAESKDSKREAYKLAAKEMAACLEDGMTQVAVATAIGCSRGLVRQLLAWHASGFKADTPWLADEGATTRAARSHAKKLLGDENEATKLIAGLSSEERATVAKVIARNPSMSRDVGDAVIERHRNPAGTSSDPEPKLFPLLHYIEGDRLRMYHAAQAMAGRWQDGRHDIGEEEEKLVRDSMAQAVIEVEKTITDALRGGVQEEVR